MFECPDCKVNMPFDHTDYYDFDIFKCPKCGREEAVLQSFYLDDEGLMAEYGDDYFDDDYDWSDEYE